MPKETDPKAPNRWEGTHTYTRAGRGRGRTVAQVREDAAARLKIDREKRRVGVEKLRRNSIAVFPESSGGNTDDLGEEEPEGPASEEVFFDADGEEMPGSNKKKRATSGCSQANGQAPMDQDGGEERGGVDPAMLSLLMSIKKDINETTTSAVNKIERRIDDNSAAIKKVGEDTAMEMRKLRQHCEESQAKFESKMERRMEERETNIERRLVSIEAKASRPVASRGSVDSPEKKKKQDRAYEVARRTLKMWPIRGPDLEDSVRVFMKTKLKIDDDRIKSIGRIEVKLSNGRAAREKAEVLATFDCREDRDYVKSMGISLADQSNVGMSIHVPGFLLDNYYALSSIGYSIRQNQDGVKRSIKFDDSIQNIYLDIFIGGKWKRILPHEARSALKSVPAAASSSGSLGLTSEDLVGLVRGEAVPGVTAVEVPADGDESQQQE